MRVATRKRRGYSQEMQSFNLKDQFKSIKLEEWSFSLASKWNIQIVTGHFNAIHLKYSKKKHISMWYVSIFIDLQLATYKMKKKSILKVWAICKQKKHEVFWKVKHFSKTKLLCFYSLQNEKQWRKKNPLICIEIVVLTGFKFGLRLKQHQRHYILRWDYAVSFAAISGLNLAKHLRTRGTAAMSAPSHFAIKCIFILHYIFIVYWILLIL